MKHPKNSNKKKGDKYERKVQKNIMSGGLPFSPLDLRYEDYVIECKITDLKGYMIKLSLLEKIWNQALSVNKQPLLSIAIRKNDTQLFVMDCQLRIEKG